MSDPTQQPHSSGGFTFFAALFGFALFVGVLWYVYAPQRPAPLGIGTHSNDERVATLKKLQDKELAAGTHYGWMDKDKGVVRLPLDRAVELTIQELGHGAATK